ncbi:MAG: hypothetical protein AB7T63_00295 [Planctomycetota bacterium]
MRNEVISCTSYSIQAKLARKYGIPLLAELDLWRAMGLGSS